MRPLSIVLHAALLGIWMTIPPRDGFGFGAFDTVAPFDECLEHHQITRDGLRHPDAAQRFADGQIRFFQSEALEAIVDADAGTDALRNEQSLPIAHFDNEQFELSDRRLVNVRDATAQAARECKPRKAWELFGRGLHTLQDFYSHSNWVDMGHVIPYDKVGSGEMLNPAREDRACSEIDGASFLLGDALTSGYWEHSCPPFVSTAPDLEVRKCLAARCGDGLVDTTKFDDDIPAEQCDLENTRACSENGCDFRTCQCKENDPGDPEPPGWTNTYLIPPPWKCLHGFNAPRPLGVPIQGISKDCVDDATGQRARQVAARATTEYWDSVRKKILMSPDGNGEAVLCRFYGYTGQQCAGRSGLLNGNFDQGTLDGWTFLGDSSVIDHLDSVPELVSPRSGDMNLMRSNGSERASASDIAEAVGVPPRLLSALLGGSPTLGTVTYQTVLGHEAKDRIEFEWNLLARDASHDAYAFVVLCKVGPGDCQCDPDSGDFRVSRLANARDANFTTSNRFIRQTGWKPVSFELPYAGDSLVAIGIIDLNDPFGAHLLVVDGVTVTNGLEASRAREQAGRLAIKRRAAAKAG